MLECCILVATTEDVADSSGVRSLSSMRTLYYLRIKSLNRKRRLLDACGVELRPSANHLLSFL